MNAQSTFERRASLCHRPVTVFLERLRIKLKESPRVFAKRIFNGESAWPENHYRAITEFRVDFPKSKLPIASELLGIPLETLSTI